DLRSVANICRNFEDLGARGAEFCGERFQIFRLAGDDCNRIRLCEATGESCPQPGSNSHHCCNWDLFCFCHFSCLLRFCVSTSRSGCTRSVIVPDCYKTTANAAGTFARTQGSPRCASPKPQGAGSARRRVETPG